MHPVVVDVIEKLMLLRRLAPIWAISGTAHFSPFLVDIRFEPFEQGGAVAEGSLDVGVGHAWG